ncbi:MAG: hypothetical protein KKF44_10345 [Nanoarchaeota archaeon]|nr:hypothetical protein [Nanoarchaeota archaeon]
MKDKIKKMFLLGAGIALAGITYANKDKIKKAVKEIVKKGALTVKEGEALAADLIKEAKKSEKALEKKIKAEVAKAKKAAGNVKKKVINKKPVQKKKVVKKKPVNKAVKKATKKKTVVKKK